MKSGFMMIMKLKLIYIFKYNYYTVYSNKIFRLLISRKAAAVDYDKINQDRSINRY